MLGLRGFDFLLQMNLGSHIGLFNISGFQKFQSAVLRLFYSQCAAELFIYSQLQLHLYRVTVINFSVLYFIIIVY